MSSVLQSLGQLHVVHGSITGGDTLASNDGSLTLTDTGTGDWTVNFGQAFLSAPTVVVTPVVATVAATLVYEATVASVTATDANIITRTYLQNGTVAAAADVNVNFVVVGLRNN